MSPKDPEPILRPRRYFLPTRSSIAPGYASAGAGRLFRSGPGRRRARAAALGRRRRRYEFGVVRPAGLVPGHRASCGYFLRASLALQRSATAAPRLRLRAATATLRAAPPPGNPTASADASQRERGIPRRRGRPRYTGLVSPAFGAARRVVCKHPPERISSLLSVVPEAPDAQGSCTQAFEPVQDAAVSWERSHKLRRVCVLCPESAAERRDADQ